MKRGPRAHPVHEVAIALVLIVLAWSVYHLISVDRSESRDLSEGNAAAPPH